MSGTWLAVLIGLPLFFAQPDHFGLGIEPAMLSMEAGHA